MNFLILLFFFILLSLYEIQSINYNNNINIINNILNNIKLKWNIQKYPSFLKSFYFTNISKNKMKLKLINKLKSTQNALNSNNNDFIISFLGSSSTIGYDIFHDKIFTIKLENNIKNIFNKLNINLIIRNVGIGTNLCFPYGICVNTFSGYDSDIVFWEHTYDCGYPECGLIIEQFIRQALSSPSHPIIALGSSYFPNW